MAYKWCEARRVPPFVNVSLVDAKPLPELCIADEECKFPQLRPWVLGVDKIDGERRDSPEIIYTAGYERGSICEVRRDLYGDFIRKDIPRDADRKADLLRVDRGTPCHGSILLWAEVLNDHLLDVAEFFMKIADDHERLFPIVHTFSDTKENACGKRDTKTPRVLDHPDSDSRVFSGRVPVSGHGGCRLQHQPHARIHFGEPLHLLKSEDSGIGMGEEPDLDCLLAEVIAVVQDIPVSYLFKDSGKSRFETGPFPEREKGLRASERCTPAQGIFHLRGGEDAPVRDRCAERAVPAPVVADGSKGEKDIARVSESPPWHLCSHCSIGFITNEMTIYGRHQGTTDHEVFEVMYTNEKEAGMPVIAFIPFKPVNPKTRLSCVLEKEEREAFARMMLADVVEAVSGAGCMPKIISTEPYACRGTTVEVIPGGLNETLNALLAGQKGPVLIIMADLPLATPQAVMQLISSRREIAIAPGRGGGTNAIYLSKGSSYRVDYYGASFLKHAAIAQERGLTCEVIDSFRLHTDVDEKEDLVELLIHGRGRSRQYLESLGFSLSIEKGRVGVVRRGLP